MIMRNQQQLQNLSRPAALLVLAAITAGCTANGGSGTGAGPSTGVSGADPGSGALPTVALAVTPATLQAGQSARISWSSSNAATCAASGAWNGAQQVDNATGIDTGPLSAGTYSYGITCTGVGGINSDVKTLVVGQASAPDVTLTLSPLQIRPADSASLTWISTGASSCTGSGGTGSDNWSGTQSTSDSAGFALGPFATQGQYSYTLTCVGPGGTADSTQLLTVDTSAPPPPPNITLSASPPAIQQNGSTALTWNASNSTACFATGGVAGDGWSGSKPTSSSGFTVGPISSNGQYVYTLNCSGSGGSASASTSLAVGNAQQGSGVSVAVTVDPLTITAGGQATLQWNSANTTSCQASGSWNGTKPTAGSGISTGVLSTPGTYSYTLSCTGSAGTATETASLTVNPPPAVIDTLAATPTTLVTGQSTVLSWDTEYSTGCTASGGTGSDGWNGTVATSSAGTHIGPFTVPGTYTYTLSCTGPSGGSGPRSVPVTVNAAPVAASVVTFSASPNSIVAGGTYSLLWTSANATFCTASNGTGSDSWPGQVGTSSTGRSIGPVNAAGTYTYTLTCTGPGGTSPAASVTVGVGAATPPASISSFTATTTTILAGQTLSLSWSTSNATSCTASNGSGSDGWSGSVATSSSGTTIGPVSLPGTYSYTLVCVGPGGSSGPVSLPITVSPLPVPAAVTAFAVTPTSIQAGQTVSLSWATTGATGCTATGGSGSDGWSGSVPTASAGTTVGPINQTGTFTYTLTCTGPGGTSPATSASVVVTPVPVGPPSITFTANGTNPTQIAPSQPLVLRWSTANASSCSAAGGDGSASWSGNMAVNSSGLTLNASSTPGIYTYTLSCTGTGGSSTASVVVTVISSSSADCGIGVPSMALLAPASSVSSSINGLCLLGCSVTNTSRVIDSTLTNYATMTTALGVAAYDSLRVTDSVSVYPAGRRVGFLVTKPGSLLSLGLLPNLTIRTLLNGTVQESGTAATLLQLSALGLFSDPDEGFVSFTTSKPFNAVRLDLGSLVSLNSTLNVYNACVTLQ